jgi:hypothetical protein
MRTLKKWAAAIIMWLIFTLIVTSPFWSVVLVMESEGVNFKPPAYRGESWVAKQYYDALHKSAFRKVGLDDKL